MKIMKTQSLFFFFLVFCFFTGFIDSSAPTTQEQCTNEFSKVGVCISFATGKATSPSDDCCSTVKDIKDRNPVCLCFIIQQTHDGQSSLKQMGLQETKLIQLPSACKLTNASISECPKLLNLSPSSPDYAIFSNNSSSPETSTPTTPSTPKDSSSIGFMHGPNLAGPMAIAIAALVLIYVLPMGRLSLC